MDEYMAAMFLPHTTMSGFPNVEKKIQSLQRRDRIDRRRE
jgi:hypothetical protein